ncbi:transglutaminase-like domain-containing protein [Gemmobacter caeruleus]|uniref:transglutaminase-like domain-containing protein n=1 Tax=Gemmobacter caeruleus TaxID=2595004 RepID=UPI0011EE8483|nr:transglutaminase-like domain-containing protein [Gemmobacter caeruleus]
MTQDTLARTEFFDFDTPEMSRFVARSLAGSGDSQREQAVALFYAVRDGLLYEIYNADFAPEDMRSSAILRKGAGLCIHKSIVYASALRSIGIPARLWFTDVRNHLCSDQLARLMGDKTFHYHCLVSLNLDGRWIKATPVFNKRLCQLFRMRPLDFDGQSDCVHHPFDDEGRQHMEVLRDHGEFDDLPHDMILSGLRQKHASLFATPTKFQSGSLRRDAMSVTAM